MNAEEKRRFYIAMCKMCTLSQVMRDCPGCLFNIGLKVKAEEAQAITAIKAPADEILPSVKS